MARALFAAAIGQGRAVASTSQLGGALFVLCVAAAVLGVVVFGCGHSRKNKPKHNNVYGQGQRPNMTYYGYGGGGYPNYASDRAGGRAGLGTGLAVGAAAGVVTAVAIDAATNCGGGGCGGGGCGGGGCGG